MMSHKTELYTIVSDHCDKNNVKCLFAVEHSSRVWGYSNPNSDHDVMFVYVRPLNDYLSLTEKKDTLSLKGNLKDGTEFTLTGWDLKKFLSLMMKSNPTALEIISVLYAQKEFVYYDVSHPVSEALLYPCFEQGLNYNRYTLTKSYNASFLHHIDDYKRAKDNKDIKLQMKHIVAACWNLNLSKNYLCSELTRSYFMNYNEAELDGYMRDISTYTDYHKVLIDLKNGRESDIIVLNQLYNKLTNNADMEEYNKKLSEFDFKLALNKPEQNKLDSVFRNIVRMFS